MVTTSLLKLLIAGVVHPGLTGRKNGVQVTICILKLLLPTLSNRLLMQAEINISYLALKLQVHLVAMTRKLSGKLSE